MQRVLFPQQKVAFFDVLGFKSRFDAWKLQGMLDVYLQLIANVDRLNQRMQELFRDQNFPDTAIWTAEGNAVVLNRIHGAYASDSLTLWSNHEFRVAHGLTAEEKTERMKNPSFEWQYHPIPNDRIIDACNELICHSLEVGLPLRGALASGEAVLDKPHSIFLGQPIIDAVQMEGAQYFIGASLAKTITTAASPSAFVIPYNDHIRSSADQEIVSLFSEYVLDWPRYWRETRKADLMSAIASLDTDSRFSGFYQNTIRFAEFSEKREVDLKPVYPPSVRKEYSHFSHKNIGLQVRFLANDKET